MIQLHPDCLIFETTTGESIPCSAELVTVELIGKSGSFLDPAIIHEAAAAVVFYFKHELRRITVSVQEFAEALAKVLRSLGISVSGGAEEDSPRVAVSDLADLAAKVENGYELAFFGQLRQELHDQLLGQPEILRFRRLKLCVKRMVGAKRWCARCQRLNDQIVAYLRECLSNEKVSCDCALVVQ